MSGLKNVSTMSNRGPKGKSTNTSSVKISKQWTMKDKQNLLDALRKYGHTDIDNIAAMLPNKTSAAVRIKINKLMRESRAIDNEHSALGTWLESPLFNDKSLPIPQALKFISLFEKHPTPETSGGFDFRAVYEFLYRMTMGLPVVDLPAETSAKLDQLIGEVSKEVWPGDREEIVGYVGSLEKKKRAQKCYPPMCKLESRRMIGPDID